MKHYTPIGTEIKEYDKFVGDFTRKDFLDPEDVMTREEWLECVDDGDFIPYDGHLGEIVIDGKLTCFELKDWAMEFYLMFDEEKWYFSKHPTENECYRIKLITMEEFKALEGEVTVCWYNR